MSTSTSFPPARTRGSSLVEVLVAFLVVSLGILAAARVQTTLRQGAELARQRSEAVRLAQQDIEGLRAFAVRSSMAGARAFADIASRSSDDDSLDATTRFTLTRQVRSDAGMPAKQIDVRVAWTDVAGRDHAVRLDTLVAGNEPALSGALALPPAGAPVNGPQARAVHIPGAAVDLGNGSSGLLLPADAAAGAGSLGGTALVFDNASGTLTARCTTAATANLRLADLGPCERTPGMLLSGHVRFDGRATALPFGVQLALADASNAAPPWCGHSAPTLEAGTAFVAYHCVVYPPSGRSSWSGRLDIVPVNWTLGRAAGAFQVCRASVDLDGSGAIDANLEHPGIYTDVRGALTHQNFSIVEGTQNCGVGDAPHQP